MIDELPDVATGLAVAQHDHTAAARFWGAAWIRMKAGSSPREPVDERVVEPLIAQARLARGDAACGAAEAQGWAQSQAAAMEDVRCWLAGIA